MATSFRLKPPRRGRPPGGFTQHNRLVHMQTVLENHPEGLLLSELAGATRVSTRSVRRYLRELDKTVKLESVQERPGAPLAWRIKPTERGRAVMLRRTQAYGLLAVRRAFDVMRGSALYDELDVVTRQLVQLAHRPTHLGASDVASDTRVEDRILFVPDVQRAYAQKGAELDDLFRAVADLRVLSFRYDEASAPGRSPNGDAGRTPNGDAGRSPNGDADRARPRLTVHPYAMILYRGAIHSLARVPSTGRVETFLLDRIADTQVSDTQRFRLPNDFDADEYVHGAFGVAAPGAKARVLIEFEPAAADVVRAQRVHPTQRIAASPDGRVRLSMTVPLLDSVVSWIVGFGPQARVIEPRELILAVTQTLRAGLQRYG